MNITEKSVYQILAATDPEGLSTKELLVALNQRMNKKTQLRKALRKLAQKKICYKKDNRYYLKENHAPKGKQLKSEKKPAGSPSRVKRYQKPQPDGVYLLDGNTSRIYCYKDQQYYALNERETAYLLHGDQVKFTKAKKKSGTDTVALEGIIQRRLGMLKGEIKRGRHNQWFFRSDHPAIPQRFKVVNSRVTTRMMQSPVFLEITRYPVPGKTPEGRIDHMLTESPSDNPIVFGILSENNIHTEFPKKALAECQNLPKSVRLEAKENRKDLRSLPFVTMDGSDAKDFDDAVFVRKENSGYRLWVSIADVSAYVRINSQLDLEARRRATSTYLPAMVFPMLPEPLSNGICSLKEGVNRKTITCEMFLDGKGEPETVAIYRSMNKIARRLTYEEVDRYYATGALRLSLQNPPMQAFLDLCREISTVLAKKRSERGSLDFPLPETRFIYDRYFNITDIRKTFQTTAMKVIEQFMLEANENVARYCEKNNIPIIWRNHAPPLPERLIDLKNLFWRFDIPIPDLHTGKDINQALKAIEGSKDKDILSYSVLRAMSLAIYETKRHGHFGLGASHYCHFTSPIRRYPDLVVHRALVNHLESRKTAAIPDLVAVNASEREQASTNAERLITKFTKMIFISDRIGEIMPATIVNVQRRGCIIEIESPYVDGFLPYASIMDDRYEYDESRQVAVGLSNGREIKKGIKIRAMLTTIDKRFLLPEFSWIDWLQS